MRVVISLCMLLLANGLQSQDTLITKTKIPLGFWIRDMLSDSLIDISTICDGFDENGMPINMIVPHGASTTIILPGSENTDDVGFFKVDISGFESNVSIDSTDFFDRNDLYSIYNKEAKYKGQPVLTLVKDSQNWGDSIRYKLLKQTVDADGRRSYSDTTEIFYLSERSPTIIREVFLGSELVEQIAKFERQNRQEYQLAPQISYFMLKILDRRNYGSWQQMGYTSEADSTILPQNPSFPYDEDDLYIRLSRILTPKSVTLLKNGTTIEVPEDAFLKNAMMALINLSSGHYKLIIENPGTHYNTEPTIYEFTIKSSFWHQGGYWLAILLPLFLILFMTYRTYARAKMQRLVFTKKVTDAELTAIRSQLNPHFLFNSLTAIQNLVNKPDNEKANDYIVKLSRLMRLVLNRSNESFHSLQNELEIAETYLDLESLRSEFNHEIEIGDEVDMNMLVPTMLLQPYLENAVTHGVLNNEADLIELEIKVVKDNANIVIKDNGKGESTHKGNGKGMAMSSNRLKVIENRHGIKTSVDANATATGFEVHIQIPTDL